MGGEGPELCKSTEGVAWGRRQGRRTPFPGPSRKMPGAVCWEPGGCAVVGAVPAGGSQGVRAAGSGEAWRVEELQWEERTP